MPITQPPEPDQPATLDPSEVEPPEGAVVPNWILDPTDAPQITEPPTPEPLATEAPNIIHQPGQGGETALGGGKRQAVDSSGLSTNAFVMDPRSAGAPGEPNTQLAREGLNSNSKPLATTQAVTSTTEATTPQEQTTPPEMTPPPDPPEETPPPELDEIPGVTEEYEPTTPADYGELTEAP